MSNNKTCSTCVHWRRSDYDSWLEDIRACGNIPMFWDATEWMKNGHGRQLKSEYKNVKAFVQDGSDYHAILLTQPDFCCTSHSPLSGIEK